MTHDRHVRCPLHCFSNVMGEDISESVFVGWQEWWRYISKVLAKSTCDFESWLCDAWALKSNRIPSGSARSPWRCWSRNAKHWQAQVGYSIPQSVLCKRWSWGTSWWGERQHPYLQHHGSYQWKTRTNGNGAQWNSEKVLQWEWCQRVQEKGVFYGILFIWMGMNWLFLLILQELMFWSQLQVHFPWLQLCSILNASLRSKSMVPLCQTGPNIQMVRSAPSLSGCCKTACTNLRDMNNKVL